MGWPWVAVGLLCLSLAHFAVLRGWWLAAGNDPLGRSPAPPWVYRRPIRTVHTPRALAEAVGAGGGGGERAVEDGGTLGEGAAVIAAFPWAHPRRRFTPHTPRPRGPAGVVLPILPALSPHDEGMEEARAGGFLLRRGPKDAGCVVVHASWPLAAEGCLLDWTNEMAVAWFLKPLQAEIKKGGVVGIAVTPADRALHERVPYGAFGNGGWRSAENISTAMYAALAELNGEGSLVSLMTAIEAGTWISPPPHVPMVAVHAVAVSTKDERRTRGALRRSLMNMFHVAYRCHCGVGLVVPYAPLSTRSVYSQESAEPIEDISHKLESLEDGEGACPEASETLQNDAEGLWAAVSSLLPVSFVPHDVPISSVWARWTSVKFALSSYFANAVGTCLIDHMDDDDTDEWLKNEYHTHLHHGLRRPWNATCAVVPWYDPPLTVAEPHGLWIFRVGPSLLVDVCAALGDDCEEPRASVWREWCVDDGVRVWVRRNAVVTLRDTKGAHFYAALNEFPAGRSTRVLRAEEGWGGVASVEGHARGWTWRVSSDEGVSRAGSGYWRLTASTRVDGRPISVKCGVEGEALQSCDSVTTPGPGPCDGMFVNTTECVWWLNGLWVGASLLVKASSEVIVTCALL